MSENENISLSSGKNGAVFMQKLRLFFVLFKNELMKLGAKKKYIVFFIIGTAICLINLGFKMLVKLISSGFSGGIMGNIFKTGSMTLSMLGFFTEIFIPFIAFLAASDLIGNEYQSGSIRALLIRPVSRTKIYFSKILAVFSVCVISFLGIYAVNLILDAITGNLSGADFVYSLSVYIIDVIPVLLTVLLAVFINCLCKSSGMSMFISIVVYAALKVGGIFIPSLSGLLFTGYTQWHSLWLGTSLPFTVILGKLMLIIGYATVLASGGYYIFLKSDF